MLPPTLPTPPRLQDPLGPFIFPALLSPPLPRDCKPHPTLSLLRLPLSRNFQPPSPLLCSGLSSGLRFPEIASGALEPSSAIWVLSHLRILAPRPNRAFWVTPQSRLWNKGKNSLWAKKVRVGWVIEEALAGIETPRALFFLPKRRSPPYLPGRTCLNPLKSTERFLPFKASCPTTNALISAVQAFNSTRKSLVAGSLANIWKYLLAEGSYPGGGLPLLQQQASISQSIKIASNSRFSNLYLEIRWRGLATAHITNPNGSGSHHLNSTCS